MIKNRDIVGDIRRKAAALKKKIVLPEGEEKRTVQAAAILKKEGLCVPILLGNPDKARKVAAENSADISGVEIVEPAKDAKFAEYAAQYYELRKPLPPPVIRTAPLTSNPTPTERSPWDRSRGGG